MFVRVKDKATGHELSLPEGSFDPEAVDVLDRPATDPGGEPLPVKYKTTVDQAAETKSGRAASVKEK